MAEQLPALAPACGEQEWALAPGPALMSRAVRDGDGPLLAREWAEIARERPWSGLPSRYERHLRAGSRAHLYCTAFAAYAGLILVPAEQVARISAFLEAANEPQLPLDLHV